MAINLSRRGEGQPILFLPGSFSTTAAWTGVWDAFPPGYSLLSVNLPGYGGASDPRQGRGDEIRHLTDWMQSLLIQIDDPVHLVGHSFGGQIALAALLAEGADVLSLTTFEANPIFVRPPDGPFSWWREVAGIGARLETALREGVEDPAALVIDYWTRPGTFAELPAPVRDFCNRGVETNIRDWNSAKDFAPPLSAFNILDLPCTLAWGSRASRPIEEVCAAIAGQMPRGETAVVERADHFLITTHPQICADIILDRISRS